MDTITNQITALQKQLPDSPALLFLRAFDKMLGDKPLFLAIGDDLMPITRDNAAFLDGLGYSHYVYDLDETPFVVFEPTAKNIAEMVVRNG